MGAMKARRRRSDEDEEEDDVAPVVILSSSDDEEANRDLSLEIVERARRRGESKSATLGASDAAPVGEVVRGARKGKKKKKKREEADEGDAVVLDVDDEEGRGGKKEKKTKKRRRRKEEELESMEEEAADSIAQKEQAVNTEGAGLEEPQASADSEVTDANEAADSMVLRKLLRGRRYFDTDGCGWQHSCLNCGEEGHVAADCTEEKRQKPCFVCGMFGHNPRHCLQAQDCFICRKRGHIAKDCPHKVKKGSRNLAFCLRCGDFGHDMTSCCNDYSPEDLQGIQCYVCKEPGHLCCVDVRDPTLTEVSCYNCGRSGHSGVGCAIQHRPRNKDESPSLCYVCGEEGHFARGCTKKAKPNRLREGTSTPVSKIKKQSYASSGDGTSKSLRKTRKQSQLSRKQRKKQLDMGQCWMVNTWPGLPRANVNIMGGTPVFMAIPGVRIAR